MDRSSSTRTSSSLAIGVVRRAGEGERDSNVDFHGDPIWEDCRVLSSFLQRELESIEVPSLIRGELHVHRRLFIPADNA